MTKNEKITLANLIIARKKLVEFAEYYPKIKKDFNMSVYGCCNGYSKKLMKKREFKTEGCLLGNIGRCFKLEKTDFDEFGAFEYPNFGRRVFPALYNKFGANDLWYFLFGGVWKLYQPSFKEAIERLDYVIKHKLKIPENWEFTTLSYR